MPIPFGMYMDMMPSDALYGCIPCDSFWLNDPVCMFCEEPGDLLVRASENGNAKTGSRLTEKALNLAGSHQWRVRPLLGVESEDGFENVD